MFHLKLKNILNIHDHQNQSHFELDTNYHNIHNCYSVRLSNWSTDRFASQKSRRSTNRSEVKLITSRYDDRRTTEKKTKREQTNFFFRKYILCWWRQMYHANAAAHRTVRYDFEQKIINHVLYCNCILHLQYY